MQGTGGRSARAGYGIVGASGFFGLVAQSLLLREFFAVYEGSELGVAAFFCSWLFWVGAGALVARLPGRLFERMAAGFFYLPWLLAPAYVCQVLLIEQSRRIAGVAAYELFPFADIFPVSFLTNAPVGFVAGFVFVMACRGLASAGGIPVARVYIAEAAGAFVGGVAVTVWLSAGVSAETVFVWAAALLAAACAAHRLCGRAWVATAAALAVAVALPSSGAAQRWTQARDRKQWNRILPGAQLGGSFATPQARYLYGERKGQFNVAVWNSLAESLPSTEHASAVLAAHLAQHPAARRFLVIGPGTFALCRRLCDLPRAERITWLTPDPAYPARLLEALPARFKGGMERVSIPAEDPRRYLREHDALYDAMLLSLPDVMTLAGNRYVAREFFDLLKRRLAPGGIVGVRVTAGENFMGDELVHVGASVYRTLSDVFAHLVIRPGDESWLIASDGDGLETRPAVLRERFAALAGADRIFPADGLLAQYPPDRMARQEQAYREAVRADRHGLLLNEDRRPRALLHSLLFAARHMQSSGGATGFLRAFAVVGPWAIAAALLLVAALRSAYLLRSRGTRLAFAARPRAPRARVGAAESTEAQPVLDAGLLVFSTGAVGMAGNILLMFLYQAAAGSLFLHIGLVSALYMLGLSLGSIGCERLLAGRVRIPGGLLPVAVALHATIFGLVALLQTRAGIGGFGGLFMATGFVSGVYVPLAAAHLRAAGMETRSAAFRIALADHLGGALGGAAAGLVLLPLFGTSPTLFLLTLALAVNLAAPAFVRSAHHAARAPEDRLGTIIRPLGYALFGTAAVLLVTALLVRSVRNEPADLRLSAAAAELAPGATLREETATLRSGERLPYYAEVDGRGEAVGWVFATDRLARGVTGYGGPIVLAVRIDDAGAVQAIRPLHSAETPAYFGAVAAWLQGLRGRSLFASDALDGVEGVTGATVSSQAVLATLREAGRAFRTEVLDREGGAPPYAARQPEAGPAILAALFVAAALALRRRPAHWLRRCLLLAGVAVFGVWLNAQYSAAQVLALIGLALPPAGWTAAFLLAAGVPLLVLLFGNVYCGYLCPFGALQELAGRAAPARWRLRPNRALWRLLRCVKYGLLILLVLHFARTLDPAGAAADPLVTLFGRRPAAPLWPLALAAGALVFCDRVWCRTLCPVGAFLSLLNGVRLLRRWIPSVHPRECPYGVGSAAELDCLCCDRCREPAGEGADGRGARHPLAPASWARSVLYVCIVAGLAAVAAARLRPAPTVSRAAAPALPQSAGVPRGADETRLQELIRQGRLSDREAMYQRPYPAPDDSP